MGPEVLNKNRNCIFNGPYAGRDLYITMLENTEREFIVTHNVNIKPVSYFIGRDTELRELRQKVEEGRKTVLVNGMGGIGKTHICRKLFEEYLAKYNRDKNGAFQHIGYIEYSGDMNSSLQNCLKFKRQNSPELNQEAAWRELEYLASDGKLLLFVDNIYKSMKEDPGLQKLSSIPGAIILTSRQASLGSEFEPYRIGFLSLEHCKEIYEKIRFECSGKQVKPEEIRDLNYVIEHLAGRHTITVEFLAHLAWSKTWSVKKLKEELMRKGFCLEFHKNGELINIQKSYEVLYDLSMLTDAEQNILEAFSVLPYIPLSAELCNQWLLKDAQAVESDDILFGLYQKGWLQFDISQESYALHPVFAQFIYHSHMPQYPNHTFLFESLGEENKVDEYGRYIGEIEYLPFFESLIRLEYMFWDKITIYYNIMFSAKYSMGLYEEALLFAMNDIDFHKKHFGEDEALIAKYNAAGVCYSQLGKANESLAMFKRCLVLLKEYPTCGDKLLLLGNVLSICIQKMDFNNARKYVNEILPYIDSLRQEDIYKYAQIANMIAIVYKNEGNYLEVERLYKTNAVIWENDLDKNYMELINTYSNLAALYNDLDDINSAMEYTNKCLRLIGNREHPSFANVYKIRAQSLIKVEKYKEAYELLLKAQKLYNDFFNLEPVDMAAIYNDLAQCVSQCDCEKAFEFLIKAYKVANMYYTADNPDLRQIRENLLAFNPFPTETSFKAWLLENRNVAI